MRRLHFWQSDREGSHGWHADLRLGRFGLDCHVYRHRYIEDSPDRWVVQPSLVYDRKLESGEQG